MNSENNTKTKKPFYKKRWFLILIFFVLVYAYSTDSNKQVNNIPEQIEDKKSEPVESKKIILPKANLVNDRLVPILKDYDKANKKVSEVVQLLATNPLSTTSQEKQKLLEVQMDFIEIQKKLTNIDKDSYTLTEEELATVNKFQNSLYDACQGWNDILDTLLSSLKNKSFDENTVNLITMTQQSIENNVLTSSGAYLALGGTPEKLKS